MVQFSFHKTYGNLKKLESAYARDGLSGLRV